MPFGQEKNLCRRNFADFFEKFVQKVVTFLFAGSYKHREERVYSGFP